MTSHSAVIATEAVIAKMRNGANAKLYHVEDGYLKTVSEEEYLTIGLPSLAVVGEEQIADLDDVLTSLRGEA